VFAAPVTPFSRGQVRTSLRRYFGSSLAFYVFFPLVITMVLLWARCPLPGSAGSHGTPRGQTQSVETVQAAPAAKDVQCLLYDGRVGDHGAG
jgi:hypothetical protein